MLELPGLGALAQDLLGLDPAPLALYGALLRRPDSSQEQLAGQAGLDVPAVPGAMARLLERGLVRPRPDGVGWVAQRPDVVVEPALAEEEQRLRDRQQQLVQARRGVTDLVELYVAGAASGSGPLEVERVEGRAALLDRLRTIAAAATREVLTIGVTTDIPQEEIPALRAADVQAWEQGASSRTLQPLAMRQVDHLVAYALEAAERGDEYRLLERPPMTLVVVDRHVGMVPIDQDHIDRGAYVVWSPAIVRAFVTLFDLAWVSAEPLFSQHAAGVTADPLDRRDRQLLELLATGANDEAVARQLGMGLRTVRRDIARLMVALGATSRLQAGVAAARRGWL